MARLTHGGDGKFEGQQALNTERMNKWPGPSERDVPMVDAEPNSGKPAIDFEARGVQSIDQGPKDRPLTSEDEVIAVMGVTGSGKSTFISLLTDGSAPVGHGLEACTSEVGIYSYLRGKKRIYLIDTPGFDDTFRSDTEVLKEIAFSLASLHKQGVKLSGLLYLHRITDRKMQGSALKSIHMFKALCGESSFRNVALVTTMWNFLEQSGAAPDSEVQREKELRSNDNFWGSMKKGGSHIARHSGGLQSAETIVSLLVDKHSPVVLDIQRQMVDEEKTLDETTAGKYMQKDLLEARRRHEKDKAELQQAMDDALKEKDGNMAAYLRTSMEENEAKMSGINASERGLKVNLSKLIEEKDSQYSTRQSDREKALSTEVSQYEDNLRKLQDEFDRKAVEHRREMAQLRKEAQAKSAEEAIRSEEIIMAKERQCIALQLKDKEKIESERALRQAREFELREVKRQAEVNRSLSFFRFFLSDFHWNSRDKVSSRGGDGYDRDWDDRDALVGYQGGKHSHDRDRYPKHTSDRRQGRTDPYDLSRSGRGTSAITYQ